jgi:hypothetical protein
VSEITLAQAAEAAANEETVVSLNLQIVMETQLVLLTVVHGIHRAKLLVVGAVKDLVVRPRLAMAAVVVLVAAGIVVQAVAMGLEWAIVVATAAAMVVVAMAAVAEEVINVRNNFYIFK